MMMEDANDQIDADEDDDELTVQIGGGQVSVWGQSKGILAVTDKPVLV